MKRTTLYKEHLKSGAKMVDFAGWEMPVQYQSIVEEHNNTRKNAGLFDVSHMGEIIVKGPKAKEYLAQMIPTRLDKLSVGKAMYSILCNEEGGVIDDLFIYMVSDNEFFIVVNAGTKDKDFQWFIKHRIDGVTIEDKSDEISKIDIQGPESIKIIKEVLNFEDFKDLKRFFFTKTTYKNKELLISQTGYTNEFGYEMYIENDLAPELWDELLQKGKEFGIQPAGLGARDTLRLEACLSLYGHELSDVISPIESGLSWLISSDGSYIGKEVVAKQKDEGVSREIIVFEMTDKGIPRDGYKIFKDENEVGYITSGTFSPTFQKGIGMGLVKTGIFATGDTIEIEIRNRRVHGQVVSRPFYKYNG